MVDPETFSSIVRTHLRIKGEEAERRIKFLEKLEKETEPEEMNNS